MKNDLKTHIASLDENLDVLKKKFGVKKSRFLDQQLGAKIPQKAI